MIMEFEYITADNYQEIWNGGNKFYRLPKVLFTDEKYVRISAPAKSVRMAGSSLRRKKRLKRSCSRCSAWRKEKPVTAKRKLLQGRDERGGESE